MKLASLPSGIMLLACCLCGAAIADEARPKFALLVGVGRYANLTAAEQLDGCRNDLSAVRTTIQSRFGFRDEDIVELADEQATGSRIREALAALAQRVEESARNGRPPIVMFHFSGHGSQVADQPSADPEADEDDGLDETLVPHDATKQGGPEDIRDDELFAVVERICRTGAVMWVVLDCCHSGTGARGATKVRKLVRSGGSAAAAEPNRRIVPRKLPANAIFLSACQAHEVEPEFQEAGQSYGLLTRFLSQVLIEERDVSKLSYDQLREAIVHRYRSSRSVVQSPIPSLEFGSAGILAQPVLAGTGVDRPPVWPFQTEGRGDRVRLLAGTLHGVTVGSQFQAYESPESISGETTKSDVDRSLGWLEVTAVEGATAVATVFRYEMDERQESTLPPQVKSGFAVERRRQSSDGGLRIRVVLASGSDGDSPPLLPSDAAVPAAVRDALMSAPRKNEADWVTWLTGNEDCDFLLRLDGGFAALFPATGRSGAVGGIASTTRGRVPRSLQGGWGPIDLNSPEATQQIRDYLRRITRARNLLNVVSSQVSGGLSPVHVRLELMAVEEVTDDAVTKSRVWTPRDQEGMSTGELVMRDGEKYTLRVTNDDTTGKPVFITILHIDSNMGIDQVHPYQPSIGGPVEGIQKLDPGQSLMVEGYFVCNGDPDEPPIYGPRWAVVLATRSPNQFYLLAQDALPTTRGTRDATGSLEGLLDQQMHFQTRGGFSRKKPQEQFDDSWGADVVRWTVRKSEGPDGPELPGERAAVLADGCLIPGEVLHSEGMMSATEGDG